MATRVPKVAPESAAGRTHRSWDVLIALVRADLRDSRDLTPIGVIKWLLEPFAAMLMYFLLIVVMLHGGGHAYPVFLMCALLPWRYLQGVITSGMNLLSNYANIITARAVPRIVLPIVLIVTEGLNFVVALVLMAPLMRVYGVHPTLALLWLPVMVLVLVVLVSGPTYLAAVFGIYFPDYRSTVANLIRLGFLGSTALVAQEQIKGDQMARAIKLNPASSVFDSFRDVFLEGRAPTMRHLLYPFFVGVALIVIGVLVYKWREADFAKEV